MAIVNREMISPQSVWGGQQDSMSVRDAGWLQIYAEDNQEILDLVVQAFKIAEDKRVLLPINICYDGFYLSHMTERVMVPERKRWRHFLELTIRSISFWIQSALWQWTRLQTAPF